MNITADTYGQCEIDIANIMIQYPSTCPTRLSAIQGLRDGLASVLADDVVAGQRSDLGTIVRYAAFVQLLADEVGA